ncbi:MAG TPA: hypothetical protein VNJ08_15250 [Bacteriovoracaceae bacterium]|nr:hypothetical protein [Bacteriovoracaceae bacterium]
MNVYAKSLLLASLITTVPAYAGNSHNLWEGLIKQVHKKGKLLRLTSSKETKPVHKITPKVVSFRGTIQIPAYLDLVRGDGVASSSAGQILVDGQIVCNYSPRSNGRKYSFQNCSDGTTPRDQVRVQNKIELRLNHSSGDTAILSASVYVVEKEDVEYGLVFPYINPSEGQILMYNGEAWVAADPSELDLKGMQGEPGAQGAQGAQGPQGPQGPAGENGQNGMAGATGPQGPAGAKGDKGDNGLAGAQGPSGAAGSAGPQGPQGLQGPKGDKGDAGVAGAAGAVGPQGPQGLQGAKGDKGDQGIAGIAGAAGAKGDKGDQGIAGPAGAQGTAGADGARGLQGPKGDQGVAGPQGLQGIKGDKGDAGVAGIDGANGLQGPQGSQGLKGDKGDKGERGLSEIAYLRDQRSSGTHGGTCSAGVWSQRALNVLGGDVSFIGLAGNRFQLQAGTYFIEIQAPGYANGVHQAKLKVIETNEDVMFGSTMISHPTSGSVTQSVISGEIIVSAVSTFEIQHRCSNEKLNIGFGQGANFGSPEVYTQVKITKKQ